MSPAAANKEVISGLVATDGNKDRVILFEQTADKAIVEGDIRGRTVEPRRQRHFLYKLECFIGISACQKNRITTLEKVRVSDNNYYCFRLAFIARNVYYR